MFTTIRTITGKHELARVMLDEARVAIRESRKAVKREKANLNGWLQEEQRLLNEIKAMKADTQEVDGGK